MKSDNTLTIISKIYNGTEYLLIKELRNAGVYGIVPSHGKILYALFKNNSLSMNELSVKIKKTPQTVTTLVKKLEEMGCLESHKLDSDRRTTIVSLTDSGKELKPVFDNISEKLYIEQYKGLNNDEIKEFVRLLKLVEKTFKYLCLFCLKLEVYERRKK